ncbi:adenosylcobinamide-GDP ribazoletransferase [Comamonas thiooxydans]|uniref:Adenosylcobinamide-GDP ribazoletransferase n=1 Tax=Comamonas thiooxydans TaxID=363952 RepID=A0A0E3C044_9BURK|nr:adenosylcobinamide-GDP ribazoletransferase [Comamonas thiooxydans]KGH14531.1 cobalamin synthase [Comamonas thiooxydans]KGH22888.1 cobalamin synthase [Comamonas thiooxydans]KGH24073.1 cobalamin synthase [Comamonas thiooxydans]
MQALRHYLLAVQFFSRIPVAGRLAAWVGWSPEMQRASAAHLPGVGWLVGLWAALQLAALLWLLPASPWSPLAAALISTAGTLWLTGGFHEDGLADVADGLGGLVPPERALEIMKDSRIGAYGVMALLMALLTKVVLIALLLSVMQPFWGPAPVLILVCCIHVLSRFAPLVLMRSLPHVGLAASSKTLHIAGRQLGWQGMLTGGLWCLPALGLLGWLGAWSFAPSLLAAMLVTTWLMKRWLRKRLGGMTGDCLGACQQLNELALLLASCIYLRQLL